MNLRKKILVQDWMRNTVLSQLELSENYEAWRKEIWTLVHTHFFSDDEIASLCQLGSDEENRRQIMHAKRTSPRNGDTIALAMRMLADRGFYMRDAQS